jgi:hypothetical protein
MGLKIIRTKANNKKIGCCNTHFHEVVYKVLTLPKAIVLAEKTCGFIEGRLTPKTCHNSRAEPYVKVRNV